MSIFKTQARTVETDVTGEVLHLKINNLVWIILQDKFGIKQKDLATRQDEEEAIMGIKFLTAVLLANGYEVTEEEVAENTDAVSLMKFNLDYNEVVSDALGKMIDEKAKEITKNEAKKKVK